MSLSRRFIHKAVFLAVFPVALSLMAVLSADPSRAQTSAAPPNLMCAYSTSISPVEDWGRLISMGDPAIGDPDAEVTVIEYFDPNCPHCKTLHPIMTRVIADRKDVAVFYKIPFPLWRYSLPQIEALYVAAQDNRYYEMLNMQYARQQPGGLGIDALVAIAGEIGLDPVTFKDRLEKGLNQKSIISRRQEIADLGVRGTPSVMINGRFVSSDSKSYECLVQLIDGAAE